MTLGHSSSSAVLACAMASKASPVSDRPRSRLGSRRVAPADEAVVEEDTEHARGGGRVRQLLLRHHIHTDLLRARPRLAVVVGHQLRRGHGRSHDEEEERQGARASRAGRTATTKSPYQQYVYYLPARHGATMSAVPTAATKDARRNWPRLPVREQQAAGEHRCVRR
jgi:hypothetical protein